MSVLTPTKRPGSARACSSRVAMNAAWGPPKPIGTPKRWEDPIAISKPSCPGGVKRAQERRSVIAIEIALFSLACAVRELSAEDEWICPSLPGIDTTIAK